MCLRWRYVASCFKRPLQFPANVSLLVPRQSTAEMAWYNYFIILHLRMVFLFQHAVHSSHPPMTQVAFLKENVSHFISLHDLFFYCCKMTKETEEMLCWARLKVFAEILCEVIAMLHLQHLQVMVIYPCGIQISYYHWCIIHCYISLPGDLICHFRPQWPHLPWNTGWDLSLSLSSRLLCQSL